MLSIALILLALALTGVALFFFIRSRELTSQVRQAEVAWQRTEEAYTVELAKLEKIRHIPEIIEKARRAKADVEAKLAEAQRRSDEILQRAVEEALAQSKKLRAEGERQLEASKVAGQELLGEAETLKAEAQEALKIAKWQAQNALDEAGKEAKVIASKARKDAKEKREKSEAALNLATNYALEIRQKAERRAQEIAGEAFEAKGRLKDYEATALALQNRIERYEGVYPVPPAHILDELAEEFGFNNAGGKLKLARERTRLMQKNGTAATCGYPEGWKKDHALKFVLSTFDGGQADPGDQGRLCLGQ
jgi:F0F1-type ATP synthase membrane subunit b/b'